MPWAAGVYTRGYPSWSADAASNLPISATKFDTEDNDFAAGLNNCLTKDGLSTPNTPMVWGLSNGQVLNITRGSDGVAFGVARTGGSNNPALQFILADNTGVGLGFSSTSWMTLVQAGGVTFAQPVAFSSGVGTVSASFQGAVNQNTIVVVGSSTSGSSFGELIQAGTTAGDYALRVLNQPGTAQFFKLTGDGSGLLGPSAARGISWNTLGNFTVASDGNSAIGGTTPTLKVAVFNNTEFAELQLLAPGIDTFSIGIDTTFGPLLAVGGQLNFRTGGYASGNQRLTISAAGALNVPSNGGAVVALTLPNDASTTQFKAANANLGIGTAFVAGQTEFFTTSTNRLGIGSTGAAQVSFYTNSTVAGFFDTSQNLNINNGSGQSPVYAGIPQNSLAGGNYTMVLADANKHLYSTAGTADILTIPANASVAYPVGTAITIVNRGAVKSLAINTDTLIWAAGGGTGTRTLANPSMVTALKVTSTIWIVSGTGLS